MEIIVKGVTQVFNWKRRDVVSFQTAACYQWGECRRVKRHSFTVSLSTLYTHTYRHTHTLLLQTPPVGNTAVLLTCRHVLYQACQKPTGHSNSPSEPPSPVSGLISSSSFTMPSPCMEVQCLMGEPPPILLYCSWIFGVRRLAMNGPSLLRSRGENEEWD